LLDRGGHRSCHGFAGFGVAAFALENAAALEAVEGGFYRRQIAPAPEHAAQHFERGRKANTPADPPQRSTAHAQLRGYPLQGDEINIHAVPVNLSPKSLHLIARKQGSTARVFRLSGVVRPAHGPRR
jgi:hypothetical protein